MSAVGFWPVAMVPVGRVACATTLWRTRGRLHVTAVVKARFRFVHNGIMTHILPEPVRPHHGETAPYLGQADVVITAAHAFGQLGGATPAVAVRLALFREWAVIDKSMLVYPRHGQRARDHGDGPAKIALVSSRGREPTGVVVNPSDTSQPGTFGPIADDAPERQALLRGEPPTEKDDVVELPDMFPWSYYQVAPTDQRTGFLRGDEWIVLDGMNGQQPRVQSRLPGARAQVRVYPPGLRAGSCYQVQMQSDQLSIDADRLECSVLWRGSFPVADAASARALTLVAAVELPGEPPAWPDMLQLVRSPILRAHGLVRASAEQQEDPLLRTHVIEPGREDEAATVAQERRADVGTGTIAMEDGAPASSHLGPATQPAELAISSDGVLGLNPVDTPITLDTVDVILDDEEAATVELSPERGRALRAATGLAAPDASRQLRPMQMPGTPWSERQPATVPQGPVDTMLETLSMPPPQLPEASVDELQYTLASALEQAGVESVEELAELSWRLPGEPRTK